MMRVFWIGILAVCMASVATAQGPAQSEQPDMPLTAETRDQVMKGVLKALSEAYVFPEVAEKMEQAIKQRDNSKEYDSINSCMEFAKKLTDDLQAVSQDKHLRVRYSHEPFARMSSRQPTPEDRERMRSEAALENFGFEKVERLDGNVGYLDLRAFMSPEAAGDTAAAAMNFLANCDALILDLRRNGGGSPAAVALLCSSLFPAEPVVHLNDLYFRPENATHQWWTLPYVPGKRFIGKPVYVLTSKRTFSAAEECAYNLQTRKRAKIVGERTGGGAHPGGRRRINDHFAVFVPSGRAINPVTKTNWEGKGVEPDVDVAEEMALKTAHVAALESITATKKDDKRAGQMLNDALAAAQKELNTLKTKSNKLAASPVEQ